MRGQRLGISLLDLATAGASALLLTLCYVGPLVPEFGFIAPAGLFFSLAAARARGAALLGATFGAILSVVGLGWVAKVTVLGLLGLVGLFAVSFALVAVIVVTARDALRVPPLAVAPVAWVAAEYVRSFIFTGFPWLYLGHAFADRTVLIQVADLGGAYLVSFVAAAVSVSIAEAMRYATGERTAARRRTLVVGAVAVAALVGFQIVYGIARLSGMATRPGPRLLLVQGNIDTPRGAESEDIRQEVGEEIWRTHARLTAAHAHEADLVLWSESMIPNYYNDRHDTDAAVWRARFANLLTEVDRELLTGANAAGPHPASPEWKDDDDVTGQYNSAFLLSKSGEVRARYDKTHLVPFGEFVPMASWPILSSLTPYAADDLGYRHGYAEQPLFSWREYRFGILICYEDAFAPLARRSAGLGADFLVNLSSEAWFAGTSEIRQHVRLCRFRAVESRVSLIRCCNVGVTCVIDPSGRTVAMLEGSDTAEGARGALPVTVPLPVERDGATPYGAVGDLFAILCLAGAVVTALATARRSVIAKREMGTRSVAP